MDDDEFGVGGGGGTWDMLSGEPGSMLMDMQFDLSALPLPPDPTPPFDETVPAAAAAADPFSVAASSSAAVDPSPEVTPSPLSPQSQAQLLMLQGSSSSSSSSVCRHCLQRLEDMRESPSAKCRDGALRWERNWQSAECGCFGACLAAEFCVEHGFPLAVCRARDAGGPSSHHIVFSYRGSWVQVRRAHSPTSSSSAVAAETTPEELGEAVSKKRPRQHQPQSVVAESPTEVTAVAASAAADAAQTAEPLAPVETVLKACAAPGECARRLSLLRAVDWVSLDPVAAAAVTKLEAAAQLGCCQGFCETAYCCRVHWCPAFIRRPQGTSSRYHCKMGPHDHSNRRGRHHADFAFFCADPACCNGKWFSRDETHKRSRRAAADKKVEVRHEQGQQQQVPSETSTPSTTTTSSRPPRYDEVETGIELKVVASSSSSRPDEEPAEDLHEAASAPSISEMIAPSVAVVQQKPKTTARKPPSSPPKTPGALESDSETDDADGYQRSGMRQRSKKQAEQTPLVGGNAVSAAPPSFKSVVLGQHKVGVPSIALAALGFVTVGLLITVIWLAVCLALRVPSG